MNTGILKTGGEDGITDGQSPLVEVGHANRLSKCIELQEYSLYKDAVVSDKYYTLMVYLLASFVNH